MPDENINPKPTPRINTGTVKKNTPAPKPLPDFRLATEEEVDKTLPSPQIKVKPIVGAGGFKKQEPTKPLSTQDKTLLTKASKQAQQAVNNDFKLMTKAETELRDNELAGLVGKDLDAQNLFVLLKGNDNKVTFGKSQLNNVDELQAVLNDPIQRSLLYNEKRSDISSYFNIVSEKDFDNKISGGLSEYEKLQYSDKTGTTIYNPVFQRKTVGVNEPGYRPEFNQFSKDPVSEKYQILQRSYQANQQFNKLQSNGIAADAYGQPFQKPEDFYKYLQDPINRDAYQRKNGKMLKQIGYNNVNDLLKTIRIDGGFGAVLSRQQDYRDMRVAKGTDLIEKDVIGKSGTVFDEQPNSTSIAGITDSDIGRILFEHDLGNDINIDVSQSKGQPYKSLNHETIVNMLANNGLEDDEQDEVLEKYRSAYERTYGQESYEKNREKMGYFVDNKGVRKSRYDELKEQRALSDLDEDERKISSLYDQIRDIYKQGQKVNGKQVVDLAPEQLSKINYLKAQITQLKRNSGFFGFGTIPEQEFFSPDGQRLEGDDQKKAQTVFTNTMQGEKKTDLAILKEKRNILYEQVDNLEKRINTLVHSKPNFQTGQMVPIGATSGFSVSLPSGYDEDKLNSEYEAAKSANTPWFASLYKMIVPFAQEQNMALSDQEKANYIYLKKLSDKVLEKRAQIKAVNKLIYTNADLTKIEASGVFSNIKNTIFKNTAETFTGGMYLTPSDELETASQFLQSNGMYVNPEIVDSLKGLQEDQTVSQSVVGSLGTMMQLIMYRGKVSGGLKAAFLSKNAVAARAYMGNRFGKSGIAAYSMLEKAAVDYGQEYLLFSLAGQEGGQAVAEKLGSNAFDKITGVLNLGKFIPANIFGKLMTIIGRSTGGLAGEIVEETSGNIWSELKDNGFDVLSAVENAYGHTDDERLTNFRALALSCSVFSLGNVSHLNLLVKTRSQFQTYLDQEYGDNITEADQELLNLLDQTIKNTKDDDQSNQHGLVTAPVLAVDGRGNTTAMPFDQPMVMSSGPVDSDQKTTTASSASSDAGSEGLKVEKRTGNMGEEFYVSSKNGVVDNKVVYRYNSETGELEAKGLTSTTEDFVTVNQKTREFIEQESLSNGIVSKENAENLANKNIEARRKATNRGSESVDDNKVSYQNNTETAKRKKERIDKVESSANSRYNKSFDEAAQARVGLFTGISEEVNSADSSVKDTATEMSRNFAGKMKINLTSFFKDGKALVTDLARKKLAKIGDYMAPLFRDFDSTFSTTNDSDPNNPVIERQADAVTDKVREAVSRNSLFNEIFGKMVSEGRMSKEDAVDNFIINLLQNSHDKVKEIFGNDKVGLENFKSLRKEFQNFVANKYTGSSSFSTTNKFIRNTPMSTSTTKNRKSELKQEAAKLAEDNLKRKEIKNALKSSQKEGAFVTDDQVDAVRYKNGEISAAEFLENIGKKLPMNTSADDATKIADGEANSLVDFDKYQKATDLVNQNENARVKYRKELSKQAGLVWGFKPTLKTIFKTKRSRAERKAYIEIYIRAIEEAATRANMTLDNFMQTELAVLKRSENQFLDFLNMTPNLVPLYQMAANYNPESLVSNLEKASDLKDKGFTPRQIELMTGLTFNESGEASISAEAINVDFNANFIDNLGHIVTELFFTSINTQKAIGKKILGRFNLGTLAVGPKISGPKKPLYVTSLYDLIKDNKALLSEYPDLSQMNIRFIEDNTSSAISFRPNLLYTGKGKGFNRPGDIVINLSHFLEKEQKELAQAFTGSNKLAFENSIRKAIQHMEGEFDGKEIDDVASPSTIRSKILEASKSKIIDQNSFELMNNVLDFYIDKGVFQYSNYQSLFFDISQILYRTSSKANLDNYFDKLASEYNLTPSDLESFKKIFTDYGDKVKQDAKSYNLAFNIALKLGSLSNSKLIDFDFVSNFSNKIDYNQSTGDANYLFTPEQIFDNQDLLQAIPEIESTLNKLLSNPVLETVGIADLVKTLSSITTRLNEEVKANKVNPNTVKALVDFFANKEVYDLFDFVDNVVNEYPVDIYENGNYIGQNYYNSEDIGIDMSVLQNQLNDLSEQAIDSNSKIEELSSSDKVNADDNDSKTSESKEIYYQMFPGIQNYMGGIYDPFKKISDFSKEELKQLLVDSRIITSSQFEEVYTKYENNQNISGSVASNFLSESPDLNQKQKKELEVFNKTRNNVISNFGTAFYSNVSNAVAQLSAESSRTPIDQVEKNLLNKGAKQGELIWLGFDDFLENTRNEFMQNNPDADPKTAYVTREQLNNWVSAIPNIVAYDFNEESQTRSVESVTILSGLHRNNLIDLSSLPFALNSRNFNELIKFMPATELNVVVKFADGSVKVINVDDISPDNLDAFKNYIGTDEYNNLKNSIENIEKLKTNLSSDPNLKTNLQNYIKTYVQAVDEIERSQHYKEAKNLTGNKSLYISWERFKPNFLSAEVPRTYQEHLITVPLSQNPAFRQYNETINDILGKINSLTQTPEQTSDPKVQADLTALTEQLRNLTKERNQLAQDLYNQKHFIYSPNEVLGHIRSEVVIDNNGVPCLFIHEMQSDKSQDTQSKIKEIKTETSKNIFTQKLFKFNQSFTPTNTTEALNYITKNQAQIEKAIGKTLPSSKDLGRLNHEDYYNALRSILVDYGNTFQTTEPELFKQIDLEISSNADIKKLRENTPLLNTDTFMDMLIKHSIKIASDNGLSKIIFTGGSRIGPSVAPADRATPNIISGINKLYNEKIPSRLSKLSSKLGFTLTTSEIEGDKPTLDLKSKIKVSPNLLPVFNVVKNEVNQKTGATETKIVEEQNVGQDIEIGNIPEQIRGEAVAKYTGTEYIPNQTFHSIELSPATHQTIAEGVALYQQDNAGAHGAFVKTDSGKNIIFALTNPNISTAMHELAHMFEQYMTAHEKQIFMDELGHTDWTKETSEAFARGFEKYLYDGKAPNGSLNKIFENFKKWMLRIYGGIVGTPIEMKISEPMRKMYDAMLGETTVNPIKQRKSTDVFEDIGEFVKELKSNPQFDGITDDEIYTALMRSGFEPSDVQDYFALKQRANILKQQQRGGMFKDEADLIQDETEAMRVVRDQKALIDEIENIDPSEYPIILQTLFDSIEDGDVPLAKAIQELIATKNSGSNPDVVAKQYSAILKAGTNIGRMLQLFRQLTKDTFLSSAEGLFLRNEKKGINIPDDAKEKIRNLAVELDKIKDMYKQSREVASADPFGTSKSDPTKTNLQYHIDLYKKLEEASERFVDARMPFEGDDSITDMYRSFIKGGLMTPGSLSVNTLSNVTKFITGVFVDPLKSGFSWSAYKLGITEKQYTKTSLKDWWAGIRYGMPMGVKRAWKILKDGTMTQAYQNPESYTQGYNFYKSFVKFFGLKMDHLRRAAGYIDASSEELALKHGFKVNMEGKIPYKQQAIAALQGLIGPVPDIIFRAMGATDAVFRDFAYFSAVSEQFKMTKESDRYLQAIRNAKTSAEKTKLRQEYDAMRKAYITINSDFKNSEANKEAMRYVYTNDNYTTDVISKVQSLTRTTDSNNSILAKLARLTGTGIVPFTRIPSNYAVELMEFFVPEYAIAKVGINGFRAYKRSSKIASGETLAADEMANQRRDDARDADRVLARALIGTGLQFAAYHIVQAGAVSGAPSDENEKDKEKSMTYNYAFERPYSINLTLVKEKFKEMFSDYKSNRNDLWDKENDLIIDYRGLGVFGAALYMQFKEAKESKNDKMKYVNRGSLEKIAEDFAFNVFGNWKSAGSYIIDQTFVRGLMSSMKAITDEDENKLPSFMADFVLTLSAGLVPNSTAWIDKWRRQYMVDYDAKEAPAFKMFGMKVEDTGSTLFWTKLATKMAERWPFGDATKYVDLPFVESDNEYLPVKVDAFGKPVLQTPIGSVFGSFLYNTFDVFKVARAYAGYETPDWEALVYLAVKKGDAWDALPRLLPRRIETPSGSYKFAPEEYNNLLQYNAMIRRQMIQDYIIDNKQYKDLIDPDSSINRDPNTKKPITGTHNPNVLIGYEILAKVLGSIYNVSNKLTNFATYTFIDAEREKMLMFDPDKYTEMLKSEILSPMGEVQKSLYGGQETGDENIVDKQKNSQYFNIDFELIKDPNRFKKFATGAMKLFKEFNSDPKTIIISAQNEADNVVDKATSQGLVPLEPGKQYPLRSPEMQKILNGRQEVQKIQQNTPTDQGLVPIEIR